MSTEYKSLKVSKNEGVAEVVVATPSKGNAMGPDFWREVPEVFEALDQDDAVRAVLVHAAGDHFSYGLDLAAMAGEIGPYIMGQVTAAERTRLLDLIGRMQRSFDNIARCRKPVIAAIHGYCIGGGLDMISACDVRLCASDARFSLREVRVAMVADLGSLQRLPHIIGEGHTRELAFTGKDIDAPHALSMGLVNHVYESREALLDAARTMATQIAKNPPLVVQGIKRVMNQRVEAEVRAGLGHVAVWNAAFLQSEDLLEAFTAFRERRPPEFKGK